MQNASNDEYTHMTVLRPFFWDYLGEPVPEEIFWTIQCKEDIRGRHTDNPAGAAPSGIISDTHPSIFMADTFPAATLPIYRGLGQAPNVLACILSGKKTANTCSSCSVGFLFRSYSTLDLISWKRTYSDNWKTYLIGRMLFLPPNQQHRVTEGTLFWVQLGKITHWFPGEGMLHLWRWLFRTWLRLT